MSDLFAINQLNTTSTVSGQLTAANKADNSSEASIYNKIEKTEIKSELEKKIDALCQQLKQEKKVNINAQTIINSGVIQKLSGCNNIDEISDINSVLKDLKFIIIHSKNKNGEVDLALLNENAINAKIGKLTGWSVDGFLKYRKNHTDSLMSRLKKQNCLPADKDISALTIEEKRNGIQKYFNDKLLCNLVKNPTTPQDIQKNNHEFKAQAQTFGLLLSNTPEEDKALFLDLAKTLSAEYKLDGIEALLNSCQTDKSKNEIAERMQDQEFRRDFLTKPLHDENGNVYENSVVTEEDAIKYHTLCYRNLKADKARELQAKNQEFTKNWTQKNAEYINKILEKEKTEGFDNLSEDEKLLLIEYRNLIKADYAGQFIGFSSNESLSETDKEDLLTQNNTNLLETSQEINELYQKVMDDVIKYAEEHNGNLPENFAKLINDATNGNYSRAIAGEELDLNPVATGENNDSASSAVDADGLLKTKDEEIINRANQFVDNFFAELRQNEETQTITISKDETADNNPDNTKVQTVGKETDYRQLSDVVLQSKAFKGDNSALEFMKNKLGVTKLSTIIFKDWDNILNNYAKNMAVNTLSHQTTAARSFMARSFQNSADALAAVSKKLGATKFLQTFENGSFCSTAEDYIEDYKERAIATGELRG